MAISASVHKLSFLEDGDELKCVNGVSRRECPAVLGWFRPYTVNQTGFD